jgi:hypothetical protein
MSPGTGTSVIGRPANREPGRAEPKALRPTSARPAPKLGAGLGNGCVVRAERRLCSLEETITVVGDEAIPLATTTSVLLPAGVPGGRVNWVEDLVPGATDTEVQLLVRA